MREATLLISRGRKNKGPMTKIRMLNRSLAILKPKQPFFEWLPDPTQLTAEEFCEDAAVYLIPDFEEDEEKESIVRKFYGALFEEVLLGWWTNEEDWPQERSIEMFHDWFTLELHSLVLDLASGPLIRE